MLQCCATPHWAPALSLMNPCREYLGVARSCKPPRKLQKKTMHACVSGNRIVMTDWQQAMIRLSFQYIFLRDENARVCVWAEEQSQRMCALRISKTDQLLAADWLLWCGILASAYWPGREAKQKIYWAVAAKTFSRTNRTRGECAHRNMSYTTFMGVMSSGYRLTRLRF